MSEAAKERIETLKYAAGKTMDASRWVISNVTNATKAAACSVVSGAEAIQAGVLPVTCSAKGACTGN